MSSHKRFLSYAFESGVLECTISGQIDTEMALDMLETLISLKRKELEKRRVRDAQRAARVPEATAHD